MKPDLINLSGISKVYSSIHGQLIEALGTIDLQVNKNEFVSIIGPSGCGKTTLLKIIGDIIKPTSGRVLVDGRPAEVSRKNREFGIVFQVPALLPWKTAWENCMIPLKIIGKERDPGLTYRASQIFDMLGLSKFKDLYPKELSGGMAQRVSIARALSYNPKILLMDEPFGALDALTRDKLNLELLDIWEKERNTIIFVTHNIHEAVFLSNRVVVLSSRPGRIRDQIIVDLPCPRVSEMIDTPSYLKYVRSLRELLYD